MGNWKIVRPLLIIALMGSLGVAYVVFGVSGTHREEA